MKEKKKQEILSNLKGTLEEKLEDIQERIFYIDMIDVWDQRDKDFRDIYKEIEEELEEEIKKRSESDGDSGTSK